MREYNDYANMTRGYLRKYNTFLVTIENLKASLSLYRDELAIVAPIAKYSDEPGGGHSELNTIEQAAARRTVLLRNIRDIEHDIKTITTRMEQVERAILSLPADECELLRAHYIQGKSWQSLAQRYYLTEGAIRNKASKAIQKIAGMIFGTKATIQYGLFKFADICV